MRDLVIIGAGVIGCSIALELARRGVVPTVIDRHGAAGHGSTSASCGIVRRFYSTPTMTAMANEGAQVWADWSGYLEAEDTGELARFVRPGMLFIPPQIDGEVRRIVGHMKAQGVEVEILSPEEIARTFPFLKLDSQSPVRSPDDEGFFADTGKTIAGGVFERDAGYVVSPLLATENLRVAAARIGVSFRMGRAITAIRRRAGDGSRFQLTLDDGTTVEANVLVNAAGPGSGVVNRLAGVPLPLEIRALRREVHAVQNPTYVDGSESPMPVVGDVDSGIYFRPESGGRDLIVGSLDPKCDVLEWLDDPDDWNDACTGDGFQRQVMRLMKRLPHAMMGPKRGVAGLYDVTLLDWNPVLDRTEVPGYYVAIGTSGSSFKTAPVIGGVMADLVLACEGGQDHDRDPVHVTLPRTAFEVDLGFFSRNRGAHATSGTVLG